jgi:anti-sigma factor RsiW
VTDTMDCAQARISLGVYVLGALEPAERTAVDTHLVTCKRCRAELADLEGMPAVLASLSAEDVVALGDGWPQESATPSGPTGTPTAPGTAERPGDPSAVRGGRPSAPRCCQWLPSWSSAWARSALASMRGSPTQARTRVRRWDRGRARGEATRSACTQSCTTARWAGEPRLRFR